jgi:DNA-binding NarL/FixJ family response regulator
MEDKVRIAYIEDHRIVKEGVTYLLSQYPNIEVVNSEIDNGRVEEFISTNRPDVLILDLQLYAGKERKHMNGFEICSIVSAAYPNVRLIAHTMYDNVESVNKFFSSGGMGFVSKRSGHTELVEAIEQVHFHNKRFVCSEIVKKAKNVSAFLHNEEEQLKAINELFTKTEKTVLEKIAKGYSTKQIAQQLEVSEKTVETHRKHLFDKAGVKNVAELIAFAYVNRIFLD